MLTRLFGFNPETQTIGREISAGFTIFLTMSYILFVNPMILSDTGMDFGAVITATAISAAFGTFLFAFWAKVPLAMAPGMGLNAFFAYSLVIGEGITWQTALGVVFLSGVLFLLLTWLGLRKKIVDAIPLSLRMAIPVGIGLFITFIGFQNMNLIVHDDATLIAIGEWSTPLMFGLLGVVLIVILEAKKIRGAILIGILATTLAAIFTGQVAPPETIFSTPPSLSPVAFQLDILAALQWGLMGAVFTFMFVDLFDSVGTMVACSYEAGMVDDDGNIQKLDVMLNADAASTIFGALAGTSTTTAYVESASGIGQGGRSGLVAFTTALLFLAALFFTPIIYAVPVYATAPALVAVGIFMFRNIVKIPMQKWPDTVAAFLTIVLMPLTYSISLGLTFGLLSWTLLMTATGEFRSIHPAMWAAAGMSAINLWITLI